LPKIFKKIACNFYFQGPYLRGAKNYFYLSDILLFISHIFLTLSLKFLIKWAHLEKRTENLSRNNSQKLRIGWMNRPLISMLFSDRFL